MATDVELKQEEQGSAERTASGQCYRPHVDILEHQGELMLVADMPGVKSDGVEVKFEDGVLSLHGKVEPRYGERANFLRYEYGVGDFYRSFRVSEQIDAEKIHAEYQDGVLTVHLPRVEAAKPRKIAVNAGGTS